MSTRWSFVAGVLLCLASVLLAVLANGEPEVVYGWVPGSGLPNPNGSTGLFLPALPEAPPYLLPPSLDGGGPTQGPDLPSNLRTMPSSRYDMRHLSADLVRPWVTVSSDGRYAAVAGITPAAMATVGFYEWEAGASGWTYRGFVTSDISEWDGTTLSPGLSLRIHSMVCLSHGTRGAWVGIGVASNSSQNPEGRVGVIFYDSTSIFDRFTTVGRDLKPSSTSQGCGRSLALVRNISGAVTIFAGVRNTNAVDRQGSIWVIPDMFEGKNGTPYFLRPGSIGDFYDWGRHMVSNGTSVFLTGGGEDLQHWMWSAARSAFVLHQRFALPAGSVPTALVADAGVSALVIVVCADGQGHVFSPTGVGVNAWVRSMTLALPAGCRMANVLPFARAIVCAGEGAGISLYRYKNADFTLLSTHLLEVSADFRYPATCAYNSTDGRVVLCDSAGRGHVVEINF